MIYLPAFSAQQDVDALVAVADAGRSDLLDPLAQGKLIVTLGLVLVGGAVKSKGFTGPPLTDAVGLLEGIRKLAQPDGP